MKMMPSHLLGRHLYMADNCEAETIDNPIQFKEMMGKTPKTPAPRRFARRLGLAAKKSRMLVMPA